MHNEPKLRKLRCMRCQNEWEEPLRSGARPWYCPTCEPKLAARRRMERARKRGNLLAPPDPTPVDEVVPNWLQTAVAGAVNSAHSWEQTPTHTELAQLVRDLNEAMRQGPVAVRSALTRLNGCGLAWAAQLPSEQVDNRRVA